MVVRIGGIRKFTFDVSDKNGTAHREFGIIFPKTISHMRFQPPKGDHKMITDKKCPKSYFIAKLREFAYKGKFETEEDFADTIVPCYDWTT
jgi:hypothetical protein